LLPERSAGVVVMTNIGRGLGIIALRNTILDEILHAAPARNWNDVYLTAEKRADERTEKAKADREAKRVKDTHPSRDLAAYAATYRDAAYGDATVALENGALVFRWQRLNIPMTHYHYDTFLGVSEDDDVDEMVQFRLNSEGQVKTMSIFGQEFTRQ